MEDKIYLFEIEGKKYATGALNQMDAEYKFDYEISNEHETLDYTVIEVELEAIRNKKNINWF